MPRSTMMMRAPKSWHQPQKLEPAVILQKTITCIFTTTQTSIITHKEYLFTYPKNRITAQVIDIYKLQDDERKWITNLSYQLQDHCGLNVRLFQASLGSPPEPHHDQTVDFPSHFLPHGLASP